MPAYPLRILFFLLHFILGSHAYTPAVGGEGAFRGDAACCSVLQRVAVCCSIELVVQVLLVGMVRFSGDSHER